MEMNQSDCEITARLDHKSAKVIGTLHLSLQYNSETNELSLTIIQAALMKPEIPDNVILEIHLRPHTQEALRANVYMDTGEPQETKFTFNIAPDPLRDQRFRCCVKTVDSEGKASENDLGTVTLHFSSIMGNLCRGLEIMLRKDVLAEPPPQAVVKEESEETKTGKKVKWREDTKDSEVTTDEKEETEPEDSTFNMGGLAGMLFAGIQGVANVVPKEDKTPSLLISLEYQKQTEKLIIGVIKAKNLKPVEPTRRVDPMVKVVIIMSARILKKKKTNFRKRDLHPVFNENLSFVIPQRLLSRISVILKVVDNIKGYSLGNAMIGSNSMDEELDHWTAMCESNKPIARWHKLDDL